MDDLLVIRLRDEGLSSDFSLVHFSMALSRGSLRGEVETLSCTLDGVMDLRLLGSGILGLFLFLGVSCWLDLLMY